MEIKNKRLFTVILAVLMISLFTTLYFAISANFVSAAAFPPEITSATNTSLAQGGTFPFTALETNPASGTNLASFTNIPATSTNLTWYISGEPAGVGVNGSLLTVGANVVPGTYSFWVIATNSEGADVQWFTLTVTANIPGGGGGGGSGGGTGGGGGAPAYNIKVSAGEGGTASADLIAAVAGTKITITVRPAKGYVVQSVAVKDDKNDAAIPVSKDSETKYSFIMPASDVTVTVAFEESEEEPDEPEEPVDEHYCPSKPYVDLDLDMWYHEYTDYVIGNGLMQGTSTDPLMFEPDTKLSRAMMVQILYNMEGKPAVGSDVVFPDVPAGSWFFDAITWAYENEVVFGYDNGDYGPNDPVTREQMVAILYRYSDYKGYDISASAELGAFADAGSVSAYAVPAMKWAVGSGLIIGRDGNQIAPVATATRAEVATIITRFCRTIVADVPVPEEADEDAEEAEDSEDDEDAEDEEAEEDEDAEDEDDEEDEDEDEDEDETEDDEDDEEEAVG